MRNIWVAGAVLIAVGAAGGGAAAGFASGRAQDRAADRGGREPPVAPSRAPPSPSGYDEGDQYGYAGDPYGYGPPPIDYAPPPAPVGPVYHGGDGRWASPDGRTTVTTTTVGGSPGFVRGGSYHRGASTTTVTVQTAPVMTTTTTGTGTVGDRVTSTPRARAGHGRQPAATKHLTKPARASR